METKRQPKAIHRIGNVRFVLNGTTVTAQQRCSTLVNVRWHLAGRVGLEALMVAARHGMRVYFKGSKCWRVNGDLAPAVGRHEFWLHPKHVEQLLVAVDQRQEAPP